MPIKKNYFIFVFSKETHNKSFPVKSSEVLKGREALGPQAAADSFSSQLWQSTKFFSLLAVPAAKRLAVAS